MATASHNGGVFKKLSIVKKSMAELICSDKKLNFHSTAHSLDLVVSSFFVDDWWIIKTHYLNGFEITMLERLHNAQNYNHLLYDLIILLEQQVLFM